MSLFKTAVAVGLGGLILTAAAFADGGVYHVANHFDRGRVVYHIPNRPINPGHQWHWRWFHDAIPAHALAGGYEHGHPLFICHAHYRDGVHPGKVVGDGCNIAYGGKEIVRYHYQVLVGRRYKFEWRPYHGFIPRQAVPGGHEHGHPLYICKGYYIDGVHPGKVVGTGCNIPYGGREVVLNHYKILVAG